MASFISSFDPDQPEARRPSGVTKETAITAGAYEQYRRFTRMPNAPERWDRLSEKRRQAWIDDFAAGLDAALATGWRP